MYALKINILLKNMVDKSSATNEMVVKYVFYTELQICLNLQNNTFYCLSTMRRRMWDHETI